MDLVAIASLVSSGAIVLGLLFAGWQVRALGQQRAHEAQLQLILSFQTSSFARAVEHLMVMPDGLSVSEIKSRLGNDAYLMIEFAMAMEGMGVLVARRAIPFEVVETVISGGFNVGWRKLRRYVEETRAASANQNFAEYFQWMAERLSERRAIVPAEPAYLALKGWKS